MSKSENERFAEKALESQARPVWENRTPTPDYLTLARELIRQGFYKVAQTQLEQVTAQGTETPEVFYLMGVCQREERDYGPAEKNFRKALALNPDFAPACNGLGLLCQATARPDEARRFFERAVALDPARADFYNNLGISQMNEKDYAGATIRFRKALDLDPEFGTGANNLAVCLGLSGQDDAALVCLEKHFPQAAAFNNMGAIFRMKGEEEKAEAMFGKALELKPDLEAARRNLAGIRGKSEEKE